MCPASHDLFHVLSDSGISREQALRLAIILAHIREDDSSQGVVQQMAESDSGKPVVSPSRFRRLLRSGSPSELLPVLIRVVRMLGNRLNMLDTAEAALFWGPRLQKEWACQYFERVSEQRDQKRRES
jgi:CRISPR type I-E-associated protein CasB/Cse2